MISKATSWEAPGCPFQIEFAPEKLEEIRLAAVDGFYAVPRGGIEIGGVLFGTRDEKRIRIDDYRAIECEHKTGPSFQLSDKDRAGLAALIASGPAEPLGWFHSHTRSEIFLSPADLEIHDRFFPASWQVALVLRPANMQPTRAGYFFRGPEGKVTADKSACEFIVEPAVREEARDEGKKPRHPLNDAPAALPIPAPIKPAAPKPNPAPTATPIAAPIAAPIATPIPTPVATPAAPAPPPKPAAPPPAPPPASRPGTLFGATYSDLEKEVEVRRQGSWMWIAAALALIVLAVCAFLTRGAWLPQPAPPLKLQASDVDGKLFIRWNPIANTAAKLTITDGGKDTVIALDPIQVSRGFYVYSRQSEKTILRMKAGDSEDLTTFAGPIISVGPTPEEIARTKESERVKADLETQTLKNRQLQRKVRELNHRLEAPKQ